MSIAYHTYTGYTLRRVLCRCRTQCVLRINNLRPRSALLSLQLNLEHNHHELLGPQLFVMTQSVCTQLPLESEMPRVLQDLSVLITGAGPAFYSGLSGALA